MTMGFQKMNESLDIPSSFMIFQTLDSENSISILSFASIVSSYAESYSPRQNKKRLLVLR